MRKTPGRPLLAAGDWAARPPVHRVMLLTRPGCHLCDEARPLVRSACEQSGSEFTEQDITDRPELQREYANDIPVVFVDGAPWDRWRIDAPRLLEMLR